MRQSVFQTARTIKEFKLIEIIPKSWEGIIIFNLKYIIFLKYRFLKNPTTKVKGLLLKKWTKKEIQTTKPKKNNQHQLQATYFRISKTYLAYKTKRKAKNLSSVNFLLLPLPLLLLLLNKSNHFSLKASSAFYSIIQMIVLPLQTT